MGLVSLAFRWLSIVRFDRMDKALLLRVRILTGVSLAAALVTAQLWFHLSEEGTAWSRMEYRLVPLPYILIGLGLLRKRPYQWTLALPVGGWFPVAAGAFVLGLWSWGPNRAETAWSVLVITILLFCSHTALAWVAVRALVKNEYRNYYLLPFALIVGGIAFFVCGAPALFFPIHD